MSNTTNIIAPSKPIQRRKRTKYSRNGCLNCKQIKVKCDETKPSCGRCLRLTKTCKFPDPTTKLKLIQSTSQPLITNTIDSIDHDIYVRIDKILSIENELLDFSPSPLSYPESELYSKIDLGSLSKVHSYESKKPISKVEELLSPSSIWSIPSDLFTNFEDPSHGLYFGMFYDQFSKILMPLRSDESNPIRDILLSYAIRKDYLYYAILASGARFSYQISLLEKDQINYSIFMKKSSDMLNDLTFFQNYKPDVTLIDEIVHHRLEPLLLTILFLTSDNAASLEQTWRGHLRGAKELLKKVFLNKMFPVTKTLIVCKCWFSSFEILAGLAAPFGGTLVEETELENLVINVESSDEIRTLKDLKVVNYDNYNFLFGFNNALVPSMLTFIYLIRSILKKNDLKTFNSSEIFKLIAQFQHFSETSESNMDRCYSDAGLLTIFTKFLEIPITNPINQELVHRIIQQVEILLKNPSFELLLVHWPVLVAGLNCFASKDRDTIETFFKVLKELGAGSAKHTLDKIKRTWNNESDTDDVDIVTY